MAQSNTSVLEKDFIDVSIYEIKPEIIEALRDIKSTDDHIEFMMECFTNHLGTRCVVRKAAIELKEVVEKLEEIKEILIS